MIIKKRKGGRNHTPSKSHPWKQGNPSEVYKKRTEDIGTWQADGIAARLKKSMKKSGHNTAVRACGSVRSTYKSNS